MDFAQGFHRALLVFLACLIAAGCSESSNFRSPEERGFLFTELSDTDPIAELTVGVVWPAGEGGFVEGAKLAADEINADKNGGQFRYKLLVVDETEYLAAAGFERLGEGRYRNAPQRLANRLAEQLISNPEVVAVVGHSDHYETTLPAAISYQQNGILFLAAASDDSQLSQLDSPLTFQMSSPDSGLAEQMASYVIQKGLKNVLILFSRDRTSLNFVNFFQKSIERQAIDFHIYQQAVPHLHLSDGSFSDFDLTSIMNSLTKAVPENNIDSVLVVADPDSAVRIIKRTRDFGVNVPFIVMPFLSNQEFVAELGDAGVGVVMPMLVDKSAPEFKEFAKRFREYTNDEADVSASLGYDSLYLLDAAMEYAKSSKPLNVSLTLRYAMPVWAGVSGRFEFTDHGVNKYRTYFFKRLVYDEAGRLNFISDGGAEYGG
jgi:branched-chain amino acid transport system substrate-binding protein